MLAFSDELRDHSAAATHGTFAALFTGDRNQHGEGYGNQLIDAQIGGGGASAVADGIDQSGCPVAPKPHIANVESNELHGPFLFLYRAFFRDTGGDGTFRGGRAAGTAWTPHGVERLRNAITAHGVEVPVSYGQFGGWPGVCNRQMLVYGTRIAELLAEGEQPLLLESILAPLDLDRLGGEVRELEAKVDEFELKPGDVVQYTWQGGGGYGDPLDRQPEAVVRDVEDGIITEQRAREVYGLDADHDELRRARLERADLPARDAGLARGEPVGKVGLALVLARGEGPQVECTCGHVFCTADENWKDYAARSRLEGDQLPAGIRVHADLELVQFFCPACGRQHAVDVTERGEPPLQDFRLDP
jgi:N-methylhydantoinase B